ncbi:MAG: hypothetical protein K9J06_09315 [Flavobacteriales bacterium]|nr:hypothetical protein [Flavobacteriales bacterium]
MQKRKVSAMLVALGLLVNMAKGQAPEQDCINAVNLCSPSYEQTNAYSGIGQVMDVPPGSSCLQGGETNAVWYTFTVAQAGQLTFQLAPNNAADDYDFAIYLLGAEGCGAIGNGTLPPVRCNYSSTVGATGLSVGFNGVSEGSTGSNQCAPIQAEAGQTFALLVSNFTASQGGYGINFAGSAVIGDQIAAQADSLDLRFSCNPRRIDLWLSDPVLCSSISANGSEVTVTGPSSVTVTSVASALSCVQGQGYTNRLRIMLAAPITAFGTYTITINSGTDGNTFTDACGNALASGTVLTFTIDQLGPTVSVVDINPSYCGQPNGSAASSVTGGTLPYSYLWNSTPSQTSTNASGLPPGSFYLRLTDANGCREFVTFTVPNNTPITLSTSLVSAVNCNGYSDGSAQVTASGGGPPYSYQWNSQPPQTGAVATGLPAGSRTVTVTDNTGCIATATINVTQPQPINVTLTLQLPDCGVNNGTINASATGGAGGLSYQWSTQPPQSTPQISGLYAGIYQLTVTDQNGCSKSQQVNLINNFAPDAGITESNPDCGQLSGAATVAVSSGQGPFNYQWSSAPPQTTATALGLEHGDYYVIITDQTGCIQIVNVKIDSVPPPQISMQVTASACGMDNGASEAIVSDGIGPFTFIWTEFPDSMGNSVSGLPPGGYSVEVVDDIGCTDMTSFVVGQLPPQSEVTADAVCHGDATQFNVVTTSGASGHVWDFGDGSQSDQLSPTHVYDTVGQYDVTVYLSGGCADDTVAITVTVNGPPIAAFTWDPPIPTSRRPVTFTYSGSPVNQLQWDLAGIPDSGMSVQHVFETEGFYPVALMVTDANGCSDTVQSVLEVLIEPVLYLPSAFMPQGVNQLWHGRGLGIEDVEITVFFRRGNEIWKCQGEEECLNGGWDGTYLGKPVMQGVYGYRAKARFYNGLEWDYVGTVTLLR